MKRVFVAAAVISLLLPGLVFADRIHTKKGGTDPNESTASLVTSTAPGAGGTETVNISDDTPFVVTPQTVVVVDGKTATANDIHVGMKVISRTTSDSSAPEIDLKTVVEDTKKKKSSS